jgi:uncharacterized protein
MRIWIDMATPPQVQFFRPILVEMARRGHELLITSRDFSQTVSLADQFGLDHRVIGVHGGRSLVGKGWAILRRTAQLVSFARGKDIDLAVSHNSYAQALACPWLALPCVTLMDYEGQPANHISFRIARKVIVPEAFPNEALRRYGASKSKIYRYAGIKEDLYLSDFVPDPSFPAHLGLPGGKIIVTMRPPATMATYHRFENPLFDEVLQYCLEAPDVCVVLLPRVKEQAAHWALERANDLIIPSGAVDGPNLIYHSDLVISAGGTMNREAVVLGTPVYTVYKGQLGAVDQYLISAGRLKLVAERSDINKIELRKKPLTVSTVGRPSLLRDVVDTILQ